jgi:hypothetical protein
MLKLTASQLGAALNGLTAMERSELLTLLERRATEEAEQPRDDRTPIAELFANAVDEAAAGSGDAAAYAEADTLHETAVRRHTERLLKGRPMPDGVGLPELQRLYAEAMESARRDGCPPAWELVKPPAPAPLPVDSLERLKKASVPRSVMRDIQDTQVRHAESVVYESIRAKADAHFYRPVPEQRLADFRGNTETPLTPPTYSDS